mmetsp:Transcript_5551/g.16129  ORF Transcript_5551/g.16129 Transcript_5551/m.16129 type:complete len:189 (-) Transcript_5551:148-714(-)
MRTEFSVIFAALVALAFSEASERAEQKLRFRPLSEEDGRRLGGGKSGYGYFEIYDYTDDKSHCIELPNGKAEKFAKLWINDCKPGKKSQLWRFENNDDFYSGTLQSRIEDDMCVEVRKKRQDGARLRLNKCKKNKTTQQWVSNGDYISPVNADRTLCAYPRCEPLRKKCPVILLRQDCDDHLSVDFTD